jgi:exopolysaccharide biosynthesis predicted pyruvyltransferase EpsI
MDKYNFIDIFKFLENYKLINDLVFIPNPGNAGDSLIAYATIILLDKLNIKYTLGYYKKKYKNKTLLYGGGGNLVGIYNNCRTFIINNQSIKLNNKIIILPHSIKEENELLQNLNDNVKIICRDPTSYNYVKNYFKHLDNLYLAHDLVFYLDLSNNINIINNNQTNNILNCFRNDKEKTNIDIPNDNKDLSLIFNHKNSTKNKSIIENISKKFINEINKYDIINTNRLHVAIISSLLNKKVNFYSNNYYKNESIYLFSMANKYKLTKYINL